MRILSQDRINIINFDNIIVINVSGNTISAGQGRVEVPIGRYSSKEVAKAVLETIFESKSDVYVMPDWM